MSLRGKWRVGSIFGCILTTVTIVFIILIFGYYLALYDSNQNYRISYERGMLVDPDNTPPLQFDTNDNFRMAFGFYAKPGMAYVNVSNLINGTANSTISISLFQISQTWINGQLVIR